MSTRIGTLPPGTKGFDCNTTVKPEVARLFWDAGYRFAVRYVRRAQAHSYDLTFPELTGLLNAGLAVMVVQHVAYAKKGWFPDGPTGAAYGAIAAQEAAAVGIPRGVIIWCDLEGTAPEARDADIIAFCNNWYDKVREAGFDAGLYVGYDAGLTAEQLYWKLKFRRYWSGYNLDQDKVPAVRGVCMKQGEFPPPDRRVKGVPFQYDTNEIQYDNFNNLPTLLIPKDPG